MKKTITYCILSSVFFIVTLCKLKAQFENIHDSIVQIYGAVLMADSMSPIPGANIVVKGTHRGTITNPQGVFSIVAEKGDTLVISHASFKDAQVRIPTHLATNLYSLVQILGYDTIRMPTAIIRPRPSRAEFERDFLAFHDVSQLNDIAMGNASPADLATLNLRFAAGDKASTINTSLRGGWKPYNTGGLNIFNVFKPSTWSGIMKSFKAARKPVKTTEE